MHVVASPTIGVCPSLRYNLVLHRVICFHRNSSLINRLSDAMFCQKFILQTQNFRANFVECPSNFSVLGHLLDFNRIFATLTFIFVILVLGVPMWWKTTEVYRVALPYDEIQHLTNVPIRITSNVGVFTADPQRSRLLISEMEEFFKDGLIEYKFHPIDIPKEHTSQALTPASLEAMVLNQFPVSTGNYLLMEWHKLETDDILVTSERTALIATGVSSTKIQQVLRSWIFEEYKLKTILASSHTERPKVRQTTLVGYPNYDVVISVLNPDPSAQKVHWDVRAAAETYIQPFLDSIGSLSTFTIRSQWIYQVPFEFPPRQVPDNSTLRRHYALDQQHMPHIITSIEPKLGNPITDNPFLHLIVYVPPCSVAPLHIYNAQRQRISLHGADSFLSPKWGGIVVANPDESVCAKALSTQQMVDVHVHSGQTMQVMLYLLRKLVDIQNEISIAKASVVPLESVLPRSYELDSFLRCGIVHMINSATLTLQSLIQLLDGISNIVINDDVGAAVHDAFENIVIAKQLLAANELVNATEYAKIAFTSSERAFFDPSVLALLYFPDDQKYAIYIPLFLPVMFPVFFSIIELWKFYFQKPTPKKDVQMKSSEQVPVTDCEPNADSVDESKPKTD